MDFDKYREYPIIGETVFSDRDGGLFAWAFFVFSVFFTFWMLIDRGYKVGILAGGGILLLSIPQVLPQRYYRSTVILRVVGILYYIALWVGIHVFFPDAPTFFGGNW